MPCTISFSQWLKILNRNAVQKCMPLRRNGPTADILAEAYSQGIAPSIDAVATFQCEDRSFLRGDALESQHATKLTRRAWLRQAA
jgi:hypothetical protein